MFFDGVFSMREYTRIFNKNKSKLCVHRYSVGFELTQATNIGCNDLLFLYYSDSSDLPPHTVSAAFFCLRWMPSFVQSERQIFQKQQQHLPIFPIDYTNVQVYAHNTEYN